MNSLHTMFSRLMNEYDTELSLARAQNNYKRPFGALVRHDITEHIKQFIDNDIYLVKGSVGVGRWTDVPWIAVFDRRITESAQKGIYIVYLLNKDSKTLFLTLNQGATDVAQGGGSENGRLAFTGIATSSGPKTTTQLKERAKALQAQLTMPIGASKDSIDSGSPAYDAGCVFSKAYMQDTLPDDQTLIADLQAFIEVYKSYFENNYQEQGNGFPSETGAWEPAIEEYNPGLTKENWLEVLNNPGLFKPLWLEVLAMFYAEKNGATCSALGIRFKKDPAAIRSSCTQLAKRINRETNCPVYEYDGKKSFWPILFLGRAASTEEQGVYAWKLRQELYGALSEFGIERYTPKTGTFDSWTVIDNDTVTKRCDKSFFEYNGSGVPKEICWFFNADQLDQGETIELRFVYEGKEFTGRVISEASDRRRVRIFWSADLGKLLKNKSQGEDIARFSRLGKNRYSIALNEGGSKELPVKDVIANIKAYIASKGFRYEDGLIENFYLSLKAKPFVILAGTSGTGKTRLVKLFAAAIGATSENGRYQMISVRPDWSDSSDLFGHVDLNGHFIPGAIIDFVKRAENDITNPYILCLDEMNLARVEYYLSDILSVIETREFTEEGNILTDPMVPISCFGQDASASTKYGLFGFPENLYIVGTVNMDETTFPFSKKVLDRANTIEFSNVDLLFPEVLDESISPMCLKNSFLKTNYLLLQDCYENSEIASRFCVELQEINRILMKANAHVGYRVRDEIVFYLLNNHEYGLLSDDQAMDNEIMQKILPRIQGSSVSVKNMLCDLFKWCASDFEGYGTGAEDLSSKMLAVSNKPECKYKNCAKKIAFMVRRFEEDGFTSYWL